MTFISVRTLRKTPQNETLYCMSVAFIIYNDYHFYSILTNAYAKGNRPLNPRTRLVFKVQGKKHYLGILFLFGNLYPHIIIKQIEILY